MNNQHFASVIVDISERNFTHNSLGTTILHSVLINMRSMWCKSNG